MDPLTYARLGLAGAQLAGGLMGIREREQDTRGQDRIRRLLAQAQAQNVDSAQGIAGSGAGISPALAQRAALDSLTQANQQATTAAMNQEAAMAVQDRERADRMMGSRLGALGAFGGQLLTAMQNDGSKDKGGKLDGVKPGAETANNLADPNSPLAQALPLTAAPDAGRVESFAMEGLPDMAFPEPQQREPGPGLDAVGQQLEAEQALPLDLSGAQAETGVPIISDEASQQRTARMLMGAGGEESLDHIEAQLNRGEPLAPATSYSPGATINAVGGEGVTDYNQARAAAMLLPGQGPNLTDEASAIDNLSAQMYAENNRTYPEAMAREPDYYNTSRLGAMLLPGQGPNLGASNQQFGEIDRLGRQLRRENASDPNGIPQYAPVLPTPFNQHTLGTRLLPGQGPSEFQPRDNVANVLQEVDRTGGINRLSTPGLESEEQSRDTGNMFREAPEVIPGVSNELIQESPRLKKFFNRDGVAAMRRGDRNAMRMLENILAEDTSVGMFGAAAEAQRILTRMMAGV